MVVCRTPPPSHLTPNWDRTKNWACYSWRDDLAFLCFLKWIRRRQNWSLSSICDLLMPCWLTKPLVFPELENDVDVNSYLAQISTFGVEKLRKFSVSPVLSAGELTIPVGSPMCIANEWIVCICAVSYTSYICICIYRYIELTNVDS